MPLYNGKVYSVDQYPDLENFEKHTGLILKPAGEKVPHHKLYSEDKPKSPLLALKRFWSSDGYFGSSVLDTYWSNALPGRRYIFLKIGRSDDASGSAPIVLDRVSGAYRALPRGTRVYVNDANEASVKVTPLSLWKDRLPVSNHPNIPKAEARVEKKEAPKLHFRMD
ncbi:MAG: hypothetical protein LBL72_00295 [Candidatus Accumulibacter sp.]|jgi:hypothetical protein|nr:hypothetical protein [Accumulibacter sp.]